MFISRIDCTYLTDESDRTPPPPHFPTSATFWWGDGSDHIYYPYACHVNMSTKGRAAGQVALSIISCSYYYLREFELQAADCARASSSCSGCGTTLTFSGLLSLSLSFSEEKKKKHPPSTELLLLPLHDKNPPIRRLDCLCLRTAGRIVHSRI